MYKILIFLLAKQKQNFANKNQCCFFFAKKKIIMNCCLSKPVDAGRSERELNFEMLAGEHPNHWNRK